VVPVRGSRGWGRRLLYNPALERLTGPRVYVYLSKILPLMVLPVGLILLTLLPALIFLARGRRAISGGLIALAILILWVSSTPIVASALYGRLERQYPPVPLERIPASACIILLGGAVGAPVPPRTDIEFSESVDRVYKTARLYHAQKGRIVVIAGGNQPWTEPGPPEADLIRGLLAEWGVPRESVRIEGDSRNTRENAVNSEPLILQLGCKRPILVTSAAHMPRAVAAFSAVGIDVFPVSTDVRVTRRSSYSILDYLPDAQALAMTTDALREWMGQKVYRWRGWN